MVKFLNNTSLNSFCYMYKAWHLFDILLLGHALKIVHKANLFTSLRFCLRVLTKIMSCS